MRHPTGGAETTKVGDDSTLHPKLTKKKIIKILRTSLETFVVWEE